MPVTPNTTKHIVMVCWDHLAEEPIRKFPDEAREIEFKWTMFHDSIVEAA